MRAPKLEEESVVLISTFLLLILKKYSSGFQSSEKINNLVLISFVVVIAFVFPLTTAGILTWLKAFFVGLRADGKTSSWYMIFKD